MNKSKKKPKDISTQMKIKTQLSKFLWEAGKAILRGKFIVIRAFINRKISSKQPNPPPKRIRKRRTNKS